jgi:hypothetical protein
VNKGGKSIAAVTFTEPGQFTATVFFNDDYLVERVESKAPTRCWAWCRP